MEWSAFRSPRGEKMGLKIMKSTFWGEWLALYAEAEGEITQSLFLKIASAGEDLGDHGATYHPGLKARCFSGSRWGRV
jgi:hypothetical protein